MTLRGLEEAPVETDWLSITTREFRRNYVETAATTQHRAVAGFISLLTTKVFPENQWKVTREISGRLTQNTGLILTGSFTRSQQRFPERTIHVRILWEDEQIKDAQSEGEALIEIRLRRYFDRTESERWAYAEPLQIDYDGRCIHMTLNLLSRSEPLSPQLEQAIGSIVSPYKRTPLLLLNLHQLIDEHQSKNAIPKADMAHRRREVTDREIKATVESVHDDFRQLIRLVTDSGVKGAVYLTAAGAHAVLVCGKRGSGKSYTLGVLVEELLAAGGKNIIPIIIDPMGVYHTMVQPDNAQQNELFQWGLSTKGYDVRLLVPGDPFSLYDKEVLSVMQGRGVQIVPLRLNPSDLSPDGW